MSKRIVLDQGLAPKAAVLLRGLGFDAVHVTEVDLDRADDLQILDWARAECRICVILDHDFHAHLAAIGCGQPSVVFLRAEGLSTDAQAELISKVWDHCESALAEGAAVSATPLSVRVRRLPLTQP